MCLFTHILTSYCCWPNNKNFMVLRYRFRTEEHEVLRILLYFLPVFMRCGNQSVGFAETRTAVVPNFALYPCFVGVVKSIRLKNIIWLKFVQCAPEAAKILSQYGTEKHQRNSISVLVEFLCTMDSRLFSAGASRILVHALHATRLGRTSFPHDEPFCP